MGGELGPEIELLHGNIDSSLHHLGFITAFYTDFIFHNKQLELSAFELIISIQVKEKEK